MLQRTSLHGAEGEDHRGGLKSKDQEVIQRPKRIEMQPYPLRFRNCIVIGIVPSLYAAFNQGALPFGSANLTGAMTKFPFTVCIQKHLMSITFHRTWLRASKNIRQNLRALYPRGTESLRKK